jgi:hypothetical protein
LAVIERKRHERIVAGSGRQGGGVKGTSQGLQKNRVTLASSKWPK